MVNENIQTDGQTNRIEAIR